MSEPQRIQLSSGDEFVTYWTCPDCRVRVAVRDSLAYLLGPSPADAFWPAWPEAEELIELHEHEAHGIEAA